VEADAIFAFEADVLRNTGFNWIVLLLMYVKQLEKVSQNDTKGMFCPLTKVV